MIQNLRFELNQMKDDVMSELNVLLLLIYYNQNYQSEFFDDVTLLFNKLQDEKERLSRENTPIQKLPSPVHQSIRDKISYIPRPSYMIDDDEEEDEDNDDDNSLDIENTKYRKNGSSIGVSNSRRDEFENDKRLDTVGYVAV